jgi:predicted O-methyltransferase YrrM
VRGRAGELDADVTVGNRAVLRLISVRNLPKGTYPRRDGASSPEQPRRKRLASRTTQMTILNDPNLERLLDRLHELSDAQTPAIREYRAERDKALDRAPEEQAALTKAFLADKIYALDRDKAEFCYQICRTIDARRVVEIGTSYGVSTLYLAAAVRDNIRAGGGSGVVIGTEYEPEKARAARANFDEAELSSFIDLREGDLRETLRGIEGPVDFMLVDIWIPMARPALELVAPHLRQRAVVTCDNTGREDERAAYKDYFAFINDPAQRFRTMTLPFSGGLEMSVRLS